MQHISKHCVKDKLLFLSMESYFHYPPLERLKPSSYITIIFRQFHKKPTPHLKLCLVFIIDEVWKKGDLLWSEHKNQAAILCMQLH